METISIPNLAAPPPAPQTAASTTGAGTSAGAGTVPSFAQTVHEAIVRTTPPNDSRPAPASPSRGSSISTNPNPSARVSANPRSGFERQAGSLATLSKLPWIDPIAIVPPLPIAIASDSQTAAEAVGGSAQNPALLPGQMQGALPHGLEGQSLSAQLPATQIAGTPSLTARASFLQAFAGQASPAPNAGAQIQGARQLPADTLAPQTTTRLDLASPISGNLSSAAQWGTVQALTSPAPAAPSAVPQTPVSPTPAGAAGTQLRPSLPASDAVPFLASSPIMPSGISDQAAASFDRKSVPADSQLQNDANQTNDPSNSTSKLADVHIQSVLTSSPDRIPLSSLLPQIAQLQVPPQPNASATAGSSPTPVSAVKHVATEASIGSLPPFAPGFTGLILPLSGSVAHQPAPNAAPAITPGAVSPQADHGKSQDGLFSRDARGAADSSSSMPAHDATPFQQALSVQVGAKPEVAPAASAPALTALATPPFNEHGASPAAALAQETPAPLPQPGFHQLDSAASRFVNDAQLLQNATHSEMRIAMQTDKLGAVELHARVAGDQVGAAILVEKRDAHAALAIELPALQQALSEKQLRVDQVTLIHGPLHASTGDAGAQSQAQQGDRGGQRPGGSPPLPGANNNFYVASQQVSESRGIFDSQGRLSVRA